MKVVVNGSFGCFELSEKQANLLNVDIWDESKEVRTNPLLIASIEAGDRGASDDFLVLEIPDDAHFVVSDYDGLETLYWSTSEIFVAKGSAQ